MAKSDHQGEVVVWHNGTNHFLSLAQYYIVQHTLCKQKLSISDNNYVVRSCVIIGGITLTQNMYQKLTIKYSVRVYIRLALMKTRKP